MYLDRDVPADPVILGNEDDDPVEVPRLFRTYIHYAREIAKNACERLSESEKPKRSEADFWCDMLDDLNQIERDIELVTGEMEDENGS